VVSDPPPSRHRAVSPVTGGGPLSIPVPFFGVHGLLPQQRFWIDWGHIFQKKPKPTVTLARFWNVRRVVQASFANLGNGFCRRPTLPATAIDWSAAWKRMRLQARSDPHASGSRARSATIGGRAVKSVSRAATGLDQSASRIEIVFERVVRPSRRVLL
jgi:hypothetical protein